MEVVLCLGEGAFSRGNPIKGSQRTRVSAHEYANSSRRQCPGHPGGFRPPRRPATARRLSPPALNRLGWQDKMRSDEVVCGLRGILVQGDLLYKFAKLCLNNLFREFC